VKCNSNEKIYAMKVMKKQFLFAENAITSTKAEREVMVTMRHPFIMQMYCAIQSPERVGFIMKFINGGQLFFHLVFR
jgi:serine/threonine protein kinase